MLPSSNDPKKEKLRDIYLGLHWAATTGNVGLIKFALDHGVSIDSVVNGFVPLQLACISDNNIAAVQYLIDRGANVNVQKWSKKHSIDKTKAVQGATGSTALHVACANGCIKLVDLLLRNHARVDIKDKYGSTPLDVAQAKHETDIIQLLKSANQHHHYHKTHKRSSSDKPRLRRPSLPSITEGQHIPTSILMTPSSSNSTDKMMTRRSFSATHRPSMEEILSHSPPKRNSLDQLARSHASSLSVPHTPRSSSESNRLMIPSSPTQSLYSGSTEWPAAVTADGKPDWYGYGVINQYDDENYLLSLERRAFNSATLLETADMERKSQEMTRSHDVYTTAPSKRRNTGSSDSTSDDEDEEDMDLSDNYRTKPLPRPSIVIEDGFEADKIRHIEPRAHSTDEQDVKRAWIGNGRHSLDSIHFEPRPNFNHLTIATANKSAHEEHKKSSFFSRWAPTWSKK